MHELRPGLRAASGSRRRRCQLQVTSCSCQLAGQLNVPCGFGGPKRVLSLDIRIGFSFPQLSLNYLHILLTSLCMRVCVCTQPFEVVVRHNRNVN